MRYYENVKSASSCTMDDDGNYVESVGPVQIEEITVRAAEITEELKTLLAPVIEEMKRQVAAVVDLQDFLHLLGVICSKKEMARFRKLESARRYRDRKLAKRIKKTAHGRGSRLEIAKAIVSKYISQADSGIFETINLAGDDTDVLYADKKLYIAICRDWNYFEVLGLSPLEFIELAAFYHGMLNKQPFGGDCDAE